MLLESAGFLTRYGVDSNDVELCIRLPNGLTVMSDM